MPLMFLQTSLKDSDIPAGFERQLCEKIGEVLNKPMERITLTMVTGARQMRAGSSDPMAMLTIHSIGVFDKDKNPTYTPPLMEFMTEKLKLPPARVLFHYVDLEGYMVGQQA
ncbi:hypothetical protein BaRGS_00038579 [Batillaria attramentaria]|uniref:D-dopachrome decarboxylase n=1 Tax=Batillaria attramentaria TaxID=370345 RepID=A0ABD0J585_9CAEN